MQQRKMEGNTLPLMYCLLCNNTSSRLHCLTNPKAVKEKYTTYIEKTLDCKLQKTLLGTMHACEKCMHTCKNYYQFKKTSNKNITEFQDQKLRLERLSNNVSMASSSVQNIPDTTPKRKTVAAQIQDSVERFKRLKLTDITINESCQLEKSILSEHAYNKPDDCQELQGPITDSCTASDVIEVLKKQPSNTLSQTLDKQLSEVCRKGKSLLFNRNVMMLSAGDIFMRIIKEMKEACPQLFEILLTCIGE